MNLLIPLPKDEGPKPDRMAKRKSGETDHGSKPAGTTTYTIKKGDTLWSISSELGINIGALSRWNNLHPEKKLMPGDKLKIRLDGSADTPDESPGGKEGEGNLLCSETGGFPLEHRQKISSHGFRHPELESPQREGSDSSCRSVEIAGCRD